MKLKARTSAATSEEVAGLQRALDRAYARIRGRAQSEWARRQKSAPDPADRCVSVRVRKKPKS